MVIASNRWRDVNSFKYVILNLYLTLLVPYELTIMIQMDFTKMYGLSLSSQHNPERGLGIHIAQAKENLKDIILRIYG